MPDYDAALDLEQELSEIPPEYQDAFCQALERELAELEQNRTDHDVLRYLRQRRDDFRRGGFIRPDGRPGLVALSPEALYEQALPELAQSSLGEPDDTAERRRTLAKIGLFAGLALLFLFFAFRGRAQREVTQAAEEDNTPVAESGAGGTPAPRSALPEVAGVEDSLQTIGGLGGALTIGRPSAIELRYSSTEETIALAIDPSRPTPRGELRYNEASMQSDNPVAVWLFGTVLNYAIGLPDSLVRNLTPGDRLTLSTDTGASLRFVVAETRTGTNYEAGRLLSQNRIGLTLFALPARAAEDVSYAFAHYDVAGEEEQSQVVYEVSQPFSLGATGGALQVTAVQASQLANGDLRIVLHGTINRSANTPASQTILLSLTAGREQTGAVELATDEAGDWETALALPAGVAGSPLLAEFRALPSGELALVGLGEAPRLAEQLQVTVTEAVWDGARGEAVLEVSVYNPAEGAVYLGPEFVQPFTEGGDAYELIGQVVPHLPTLIGPGETLGLTVTFLPISASAQVQIGADLWELAGMPAAAPTSTGQPPATGGG
ncbi:MAG: hypothetical protein ACRDHL_06890 [Candidatus Promineifilaceae bacterium]